MTPVEILALVFSVIGKAVELGNKLAAARAEDASQALESLKHVDAQLEQAIKDLPAALAANDSKIDAALASQKGS